MVGGEEKCTFQDLEVAICHEAQWHTALHLSSCGGKLRLQPDGQRLLMLQLGAFASGSSSREEPL